MYDTVVGSIPFNAVYGTLINVVTPSEVLENVMNVPLSNLLNLRVFVVVSTKPN